MGSWFEKHYVGEGEANNCSSRKGGRSSPDSCYLITDIASLPFAFRPGFVPRPEQMFAPCCRGQIVVQTGRPAQQRSSFLFALEYALLQVNVHRIQASATIE